MELNLRIACIYDLNTLIALGRSTYQHTFGPHNRPEVMAQYLDDAFNPEKIREELLCEQSRFWLLEADGQPAGYLKVNWDEAQTDLQGPDSLELERIYLAPDYQGQGLGKMLLAKARLAAEEMGKTTLWLGVWEKNQNAVGFYKAHGFSIIGTHDFYMGDERQTDYVLSCNLASSEEPLQQATG